MKPSFALSLDASGISLLHRAISGWHSVGTVPFENPNLTADLEALRTLATSLSSAGLSTKLVLPNSQILYLTVDDTSERKAKREAAIRTALKDATPYPVSDLIFDWRAIPEGLRVAVVARETLQEAEDFAKEHKFNPLSFVANPDAGQFPGEPYFGRTLSADALIGEKTRIEPDDEAMHILQAAGTAQSTPIEPQQLELSQELSHEASPSTDDQNDTQSALQIESTESVQTLAIEDAVTAPEIPSTGTDRTAPPAAPKHPHVPVTSGDLPVEDHPPAVTAPAPTDLPPAAPQARSTPKPKPTPTPRKAFKSPPRIAQTAAQLKTASTIVPKPQTPASADAPRPIAPAKSVHAPRAPIAAQPASNAAGLTLHTPSTPKASPDVNRKAIAVATALVVLLLFGIWSVFKPKPEAQISKLSNVPTQISELKTDAGNALDAQKKASVEQASFPLTPLAPETADVQSNLLPLEENAAAQAIFSAEPIATANLTERSNVAPAKPRTTAPLTAESNAALSQDARALQTESLDPSATSQTTKSLQDPKTLLQSDAATHVTPKEEPEAPTFDLDERGLVRATPEGALSPSGIRVFAGRPPKVSAPRPERAALPAPAPELPAHIQALADDVPRLRPDGLAERYEQASLREATRTRLSTVLPRLRPITSAEEDNSQALAAVAADAIEQLNNTPTAPIVASSPMPKLRPQNVAKLAAAAQAAGVAAQQAATPKAIPPTPKQKVAAVPVPKPAPKKRSSSETSNNRSANRVTASVPKTKIPTSTATTVASAATVKNAINLRKLNLMGVYGAKSDRRALIRLASGRLSKVKVGDRVNGGRVQSISSDALTYVKSGRAITLKVGS